MACEIEAIAVKYQGAKGMKITVIGSLTLELKDILA